MSETITREQVQAVERLAGRDERAIIFRLVSLGLWPNATADALPDRDIFHAVRTAVVVRIVSQARGTGRDVSQARLAARLGISRRSLRSIIARLDAAGRVAAY
jgi:hypothetical protein